MTGFRVPRTALLLVILSGCNRSDAGEGDATPQAVVNAQVVTATTQPFVERIGAIGVVTARPGHAASLAAPAPTRVSQVYVTEGEHVSRGQPLVQLEQAAFVSAAAGANATLVAAQQDLARQRRLVDEGIVARKDLEAAQAELARAEADAVNARRMAELSTLRAPISGVVTRLSASLGASVDPSQTLVEVADPSQVDVRFSMTPTDAARVQRGSSVALTAGESASGEALGTGTVRDVGGAVDSASRTVPIRVEVPASRRPLRIGETVYGQIAVGTNASAVVIPAAAIVPAEDSSQVFVVDANNIAHARTVTIGGRTDEVVEITSGLKAGERIVSDGAYGVQDSAKVVQVKP